MKGDGEEEARREMESGVSRVGTHTSFVHSSHKELESPVLISFIASFAGSSCMT
jgi:hypothetical protein